ncbi:Bgt-362 [Blumeria graminis f. sp. tritici]|uniref:Bgt-362 n=2 Tax=Blumeria graminis f. sp. tritici TaxID=62690 RepID=A0A9X9PS31_BLUGR|nr:hypothetical protein BGT96224_362 [Blumeria graminis f. sp. tritici 96224]VCU40614.1 Bgt-362 [Blumeria graminis f. sp. tritici]
MASNYSVLQELGSGSFGTVNAQDLHNERNRLLNPRYTKRLRDQLEKLWPSNTYVIAH